jgi:hypothetical protein
VDRYLDRSDFRALVRAVADGLGLHVLDVGDHGMILAPCEESVFSLRPAQFRPTSSSTDDRLLDGLVQLAVAATVFPRARDLDEDPSIARPPVSVGEIDDTLRRICERIAERNRGEPDPLLDDGSPGLYEAWRVYASRTAVAETRDDRRPARTTRRIVEFNLDRLGDLGCFMRSGEGDEAKYQPTYRYQVLVRELAASTAWGALRSVLDGEGDHGGSR